MFVITADQVNSRATADIVGETISRVNTRSAGALLLPADRTAGDELQLLRQLLARCLDRDAARRAFLEAKTYYSLARFPAPYRSGSTICPPGRTTRSSTGSFRIC